MSDAALVFLCRRLLDIDPACSGSDKGCPFYFAAWPMIDAYQHQFHPMPKEHAEAWALRRYDEARAINQEYWRQLPETLRRFRAADGQGRACEIHEIQHIARRHLSVS